MAKSSSKAISNHFTKAWDWGKNRGTRLGFSLIISLIFSLTLVTSVFALGKSSWPNETPSVIGNLGDRLENSTFSLDWRIFMAATTQWWRGENPYGILPSELGLPASSEYGFHKPGAFAYPPTALTWLALFLPFGSLSFYVWTLVQLGAWWFIILRRYKFQLALFSWAPLIVHLVLGQNTLGIVFVLWAATLAQKRGFLWGLALAWTLTKPQVAILPILWLLWQDCNASQKYKLWLGIITGTILLAIPPTILTPYIWQDWLASLLDYRSRLQHTAAWEGFGIFILLFAAFLWFRRFRGIQNQAGWQWWLTAALVPQTGVYAAVVLLPVLKPQQSYWTIGGILMAGLLIGPATPITLPILLSGQVLAAWLICGGPKSKPQNFPAQ